MTYFVFDSAWHGPTAVGDTAILQQLGQQRVERPLAKPRGERLVRRHYINLLDTTLADLFSSKPTLWVRNCFLSIDQLDLLAAGFDCGFQDGENRGSCQFQRVAN